MPQTQSQGLFSTPLGFPYIWVADSKSISNNPGYIFSPLFGNIWRTGRVGVQQGFSASAPLTMGQESFLIWGSAIHCGWFTSIPGLYPPDASSIPLPPFVTTKNVSRQCQMSQGRGKGEGKFTGVEWRMGRHSRKGFRKSLRVTTIQHPTHISSKCKYLFKTWYCCSVRLWWDLIDGKHLCSAQKLPFFGANDNCYWCYLRSFSIWKYNEVWKYNHVTITFRLLIIKIVGRHCVLQEIRKNRLLISLGCYKELFCSSRSEMVKYGWASHIWPKVVFRLPHTKL